MTMELDDGVAVRVAALCLDPAGRLSDRLVCAPAVRGGLLLDLALAGRIEQDDESIEVDPTPTGFDPADRLLAAIGVENERSLDDWLDERRIGLREVTGAAVASGRWELHRGPLGFGRRCVDRVPDRTAADRQLHRDQRSDWTAADTCVWAVAAAAGLLERDSLGPADAVPTDVMATADRAAWLCTAVVEHLQGLTSRYALQTAGLGPVGPF
jgi:hypothetical protein